MNPIKSCVLLSIILICLCAGEQARGELDEAFRKDFQNALSEDFSEEELDQMFSTHSALLTPHSDVTQFTQNLMGESSQLYPLSNFKNTNLYKDNIGELLNSTNSHHRLLAYLVIASSNDVSYESVLLERIETEKIEGNLIWAGMALLHMRTDRTTELFDFLVKHETFGDAHMLPLYRSLDKELLQQTAYERINSENDMAKVLAVHILSLVELNSRNEQLLKEAVRDWDFEIKGYAINTISELQIGNLLDLLTPLLDSTRTRQISLQTLASSSTESDRQFVYDMIEKQDSVSKQMLSVLEYSKRIESHKYWLRLLYSKQLPEKIYIRAYGESFLKSEDILDDLHIALESITNPDVLEDLVRALEGRTDEKSTDIMLSLLKHENSSVRYWTASSLKGNSSTRLANELPFLLADPAKRTVALTDLIIWNKIDTLQTVYESIMEYETHHDWFGSCIDYLSTFPLDRHKGLFREILSNKKSFFRQRSAALGLGRLKDQQSVDLVITASRPESRGSVLNARVFLVALGMIGGERARKEIESYRLNDSKTIRELAGAILQNWNNSMEHLLPAGLGGQVIN